MKLTQYAEGGRPFYDDDIQTIQDEAQLAATAVLAGLGQDCVVSGCRVSQTGATFTVSPGLVWMGGQLLRCQGASGVILPAALVTSAVSVLDERPYQTGDTKTCIQEQYAVVVPSQGAGLPVYAAGILSLRHALQAAQWEVGDVKWGTPDLNNYDATGLGKPGSVAWGWGLCNGQGSRIDLRGRVVASYDPDQTDYAAVGNTGGANSVTLGVSNLPAHAHKAGLKITDSKGDGEAAFNAALTSSPNAKGNAITTASTGLGQPFDNRPAFAVLAGRQWVGF